MNNQLKIGISACFMHPDAQRKSYGSKTLQYVEQSTAHWLMSGGALPVMIPAPLSADRTQEGLKEPPLDGLHDYAHWLDGLVLHGGADMWPGHYGEVALQQDWNGDRERDVYEMALIRAFVAARKPVFGICRGLQVINVAYGGTLFQDLPTQRPSSAVAHRADGFDRNLHDIEVLEGTHLHTLLPHYAGGKINSIHHQGVKDLAPNFVVEARCPHDGMVEAIRHTGDDFIAAVQWHPELHGPHLGTLDDRAVLNDFLAAAARAKQMESLG